MKRSVLLFFIVFSRLFPLFSEENESIKTPEAIEQELKYDEELFKHAKEMFNPWYAGPLLTGGAHMMPPGVASVQPYIFVNDTYAVWNGNRKSIDIPNRVNLNPSISAFSFGITKWLDMAISIQGDVNWQKGKCSGGFGDTTLGVGFRILTEGLHLPAIRLVFNETFPTGRYQQLDPNKLALDATGSGSYQSQIGMRISKIFFWSYRHPMNLRASYSYTIPSHVHVKGFNSYGGGYGTHGRVCPGSSQALNAAMEYSFTQKWVFACDAVYTWAGKTTFKGTPGVYANGKIAGVGYGSSDQLSLAPAIEYNPNAHLNFLGGIWFDFYGRNTGKFISGVISMSYTFDW